MATHIVIIRETTDHHVRIEDAKSRSDAAAKAGVWFSQHQEDPTESDECHTITSHSWHVVGGGPVVETL